MWEKFLKFFSADDKNPVDAEKTQKTNILIIGGGLFLIIVFMMIFLGDDNNKKEYNNIGKFKIVNEDDLVKTKWIGQVAPEVQNSQKNLKEVIEQNQKLQREIEELKKMYIEMKNKSSNVKNNLEHQRNYQTNNENNISDILTRDLYKKYPTPPGLKAKDIGLNKFGKVPVLKKNIIIKETVIKNPLEYAQIAQPEEEKKEKKPSKPYNMISTGTITKVVLLGGMDAPTMARAQNNPLPVLMKVTNPSFLPNGWRDNIQGCFF